MEGPVANTISPVVKPPKAKKIDKPYVANTNPYTKKKQELEKKERHQQNVAGAKKLVSSALTPLAPSPIRGLVNSIIGLKDSVKSYYNRTDKAKKTSPDMAKLTKRSQAWEKRQAMNKMGLKEN